MSKKFKEPLTVFASQNVPEWQMYAATSSNELIKYVHHSLTQEIAKQLLSSGYIKVSRTTEGELVTFQAELTILPLEDPWKAES